MSLKIIIRITLEIKRHIVKKIEKNNESIIIKLDIHKRWKVPCRICGTLGKVRDRLKERQWEHAPLWGIPVKLIYSPARVSCGEVQRS